MVLPRQELPAPAIRLVCNERMRYKAASRYAYSDQALPLLPSTSRLVSLWLFDATVLDVLLMLKASTTMTTHPHAHPVDSQLPPAALVLTACCLCLTPLRLHFGVHGG